MVLASSAQSLGSVHPQDLSLISQAYTCLSPFLSSQSPPEVGNITAYSTLISLAELPYLIKAFGESDDGGGYLAFLSKVLGKQENSTG